MAKIWYELGGRKLMSRVTTAKQGVLETIYALAGITLAGVAPPAAEDEASDVFRGHPLAVRLPPKSADLVVPMVFGPVMTVAGAVLIRRKIG